MAESRNALGRASAPWARRAMLVGLFAFGPVLSACPEVQSGRAPGTCSKAYEKCELPSGVLGVCDVVECTKDHAPPCLSCRSQH